jgi:dihydroneopterin aldolase
MSAGAGHREVEISIDGLAFFGRHGALPEERVLGQRFYVDLRLIPASDRACDTDDVADAVHYGEVVEQVLAVAAEPVALLERLADRIAVDLLARFPLVEARVTVRKPSAPVPAIIDAVAVTVTRRRDGAA